MNSNMKPRLNIMTAVPPLMKANVHFAPKADIQSRRPSYLIRYFLGCLCHCRNCSSDRSKSRSAGDAMLETDPLRFQVRYPAAYNPK